MSDVPRRRASDREPISSEPALVAVLDKRDEAERRLEAYVANAQRDRKRQLYGFLFFIAVVVALFFQQRQETMERAAALCQNANEIRRASINDGNQFRARIGDALVQWAANDGVISPQDEAVLARFDEALHPVEFHPEPCPPA